MEVGSLNLIQLNKCAQWGHIHFFPWRLGLYIPIFFFIKKVGDGRGHLGVDLSAFAHWDRICQINVSNSVNECISMCLVLNKCVQCTYQKKIIKFVNNAHATVFFHQMGSEWALFFISQYVQYVLHILSSTGR